MLTVPVYGCYRSDIDSRLEAALATDPLSGWPEDQGPYRQLVDAERHAAIISSIGTTIPGILRDEAYVARAYDNFARPGVKPDDPDMVAAREHMDEIRIARQAALASRLADPADSLNFSVIIPHDVLDTDSHIGRMAPDRIPYQAFQMLLAIKQGMHLQMAHGELLRMHMGNMNTSLIARDYSRNPSHMVYREFDRGTDYEVASNDPELVRRAEHLDKVVRGMGCSMLLTVGDTARVLRHKMAPIANTPLYRLLKLA